MYDIMRTDIADEDLRNIIYYIAEDSKSIEIALDYLDKIEMGIKNLSQLPYIGVVPKFKTLRMQHYRVLIVENHLIFYKINESSKSIIVYRILSSKQKYINMID